MKVVAIDPGDSFEIVGVGADGTYFVEDTQYWNDLQVGDLVQICSEEMGTECYLVTEVKAGDPAIYPRGLNLVTMRRPYLT